MSNLKTILKAILAGMCISIGGTVYLLSQNKALGAMLFSIGLFLTLSFDFSLFTGKVGYLFSRDAAYLRELCLILVGNFIGAFVVGNLLLLTRLDLSAVQNICSVKLGDSPLSIFVLSIFCGVLMYLGVDGYRSIENSVGKYIAVLLAVMVFILSGFEHCIANMFYFSLGGMWVHGKTWGFLLLMILGNSVGSLLVSGARKIIDRTSAPQSAR